MLRNQFDTRVLACVVCVALAQCACNSKSSLQQVTIRLDSNAACYGFQIDVGGANAASGASASSQAVSCVPTAELSAAGCAASVTGSPTELHLGTRGCFVPDGTPLFDCELPPSLVREANDAVSVHCGCGCAAQCPQDPTIRICKDTPEACAAAAAVAQTGMDRKAPTTREDVAVSVQPTRTTVQVTQTTTTAPSTTGGTLCDMVSDYDFRVTAPVALSEIDFEFAIPNDWGPRCPDLDCSLDSVPRGQSSRKRTVTEDYVTERTCIADPDWLATATRLLYCYAYSESDAVSSVTVLRALGADLAPVVPLPQVDYRLR